MEFGSAAAAKGGSGRSPEEERRERVKAAAAARATYLRVVVDPVFVPLLDAIVFHKPRSRTFCRHLDELRF
jgi:hypothetical protein